MPEIMKTSKKFATMTSSGAIVVYASSKKEATTKLAELGYSVKINDVYKY